MTAPVNILNVIRYPIGGIRSYLRYTYSKLDPNTYRTTVVTVNRAEAQLLGSGLAPMAVDVLTVPEKRAFASMTLMTDRLLRNGRVQIIHSQGTTAALVSDLSARRHGIPHVVTLHETFRAEQFAGPVGKLRRLLVGRALDRADHVIAVTKDALANLQAHIPLKPRTGDRIQVIRNGVSVDLLLKEAPLTGLNVRQKYRIDPDTVLIGYIGRFMPEKGFDVLLDAVEQLHRQPGTVRPFVIAAVNDGAFLREYKEQIAQRGLESIFLFPGFQSSAAGILTELDAVIMPSRREAGPIVPMEALVLGCPLIASDCIGLRELISGTPALSTKAGNAQSLENAMRTFLSAPSRHKDAATAYIPDARAAFDSSKAAADLDRLLRAAVLSARTANIPSQP
jgi:glycosyltransferase involved in cell wall biosynthesis